jgi:hypothetical protein
MKCIETCIEKKKSHRTELNQKSIIQTEKCMIIYVYSKYMVHAAEGEAGPRWTS